MQMAYGWIYLHFESSLSLAHTVGSLSFFFLSLTFRKQPDLTDSVSYKFFLWPNLMANVERVKQTTHKDKRIMAMVICKVIMA